MIVSAGVVITTIAAIKAKERSDLEELLVQSSNGVANQIPVGNAPKRPDSPSLTKADHLDTVTSTVSQENATRSGRFSSSNLPEKLTTKPTSRESKVDFDEYVDPVPDYDAEYDSIESRIEPVTAAGKKAETYARGQANSLLNRGDNLPGYPPPNGSEPSVDSPIYSNHKVDLAADGAGFIVEQPSSSLTVRNTEAFSISDNIKNHQLDGGLNLQPAKASKQGVESGLSGTGSIEANRKAPDLPVSYPERPQLKTMTSVGDNQRMERPNTMAYPPVDLRPSINVQLQPQPQRRHRVSFYPSLLEHHHLIGVPVESDSDVSSQELGFERHPSEMISEQVSGNYYRKLNREQALSSIRDPLNLIHFESSAPAASVSGNNRLDRPQFMQQFHGQLGHHQRHIYNVPRPIRMRRVRRDIVTQIEPNDDSHESYQNDGYVTDHNNSSSNDSSGKDLKSSASGYFPYDSEGHHPMHPPMPMYNLPQNLYPKMGLPIKSPYAMQSASPHRKRQLSAYFPSALQSKHSYGMLGSGNFEVIRGGIYNEDDAKSGSNTFMAHGMVEQPSPTSSDYDDFGESFTKHPYSTEEYFANNPILGFQGYDNFKAASRRKSVTTKSESGLIDENHSLAPSDQVHVFVNHELMTAS